MTKLKRELIVLKPLIKESIIEFPKLEITVEEKTYDLSELSNLENIHEIITALKIYLKGQRACKAVFLQLRNFLTDILKINEKIDEQSMLKYKKKLDTNEENTLSTKWQKFSRARNFVNCLISQDIIKDFPLPPNFANVKKEQKKSFGEIARHYIEDDSNFDHKDIKDIKDINQ